MLLICRYTFSPKMFQSKICYSLRVIVSYLHWIVNFLSFQSLFIFVAKGPNLRNSSSFKSRKHFIDATTVFGPIYAARPIEEAAIWFGLKSWSRSNKKANFISPTFFCQSCLLSHSLLFPAFFQKQKFLTSSRKKSENLKNVMVQRSLHKFCNSLKWNRRRQNNIWISYYRKYHFNWTHKTILSKTSIQPVSLTKAEKIDRKLIK